MPKIKALNDGIAAIYFFELNSQPGIFVAATHGETGYHTTTVYHQDHADELNRRSGHSPAQVQAAETCSMFDSWENFDKITATIANRIKA